VVALKVLVDDGASALALAHRMGGGGAQGLNCVATIQGSCLVLQG